MRGSSARCCWGGGLASLILTVAGPAPSSDGCALETLPQRDNSPVIPAGAASLSAGGRFLAFASTAALLPVDTNRRSDIYVHDLSTGGLTIDSTLPDGTASNADSHAPGISADGRFVVFESLGLLASNTNLYTQVLLRDRQLGTTMVLSRSAAGALGNGTSRHPVISADGRVVAFESGATNLLRPDAPAALTVDVYVLVRATGEIQPAGGSVRTQRRIASAYSPALSGDGRFLAFSAQAAPADPGSVGPRRPGTNAAAPKRQHIDVLVRDLDRGATWIVSRRRDGTPANGRSYLPAISRDGRYVAFVSEATDLGGDDDRNGAPDVFLHDRRTSTTELVSRGPRGRAGNGASSYPSLSADARFIAFQSEAADLVCGARCDARARDINLTWDVFLLDRKGGTVTRLSEDSSGTWMEPSGSPTMDAAGRVVAFTSRRSIDPSDGSTDFDLFVRRCPVAPGPEPRGSSSGRL